MTATADNQRFQNGARDYAAYLETAEGRLRSDLVFANLEDFLPRPQGMKSLYALDVGCGTGATGIRLARLGIHVTLLDSSQSMLDITKRAAQQSGVIENVALQHGDAVQLASLFPTRTYLINRFNSGMLFQLLRVLARSRYGSQLAGTNRRAGLGSGVSSEKAKFGFTQFGSVGAGSA
jgi:SAM-dependent methyltransferase